MPVAAVGLRDDASVDFETHVPTGGVGRGNAAARRVSMRGCQRHRQAVLFRRNHHAQHDAQNPCPPAGTTPRRVGSIVTTYGQPTHSALPFSERRGDPTGTHKSTCGAFLPQFAAIPVGTPHVGIANAPMASGRLRV